MKKLLIILTVLFSLFLFTDKVCAEELTAVISDNVFDESHQAYKSDNFGTYFYYNSISSYSNYLNTAINQIKLNYKYYILGVSSVAFWNDDDIQYYIGTYQDSDDSYVVSSIIYNPNNANIYFQDYSTLVRNSGSLTYSTKTDTYLRGTASILYSFNSTFKSGILAYSTNSKYVNYAYMPPNKHSNIDVIYDSDVLYNGILSLSPSTVITKIDNLSTAGVIYEKGDYINQVKPKIEVSEIDSSFVNVSSPLEGQSFKTSATYNISFSIYDESLYDYYYSLDSINWINIVNDFQLKVIENGIYYFKITDKENNLVSSTSLDISTLKSIDYVKVKLDVNDIIEKNGSIDFLAILDNDDNLKAKPYIETFYYDDGRYIENRNQWNKEDENFNFSLTQDLNTIVYYNYVLDLINYYENIDFLFTTNNSVGFEIVYYLSDGQVLTTGLEEYISTYPENYNLVKLDLSSSSGIMIMPKNYSTNDVFSNFYDGDIQHIGLFGIYLNGNFRIRNYTKNGYLRLTSDSIDKNFYYGNAEYNVENNISYPFPTDSGYLIIKQESDMGSRGASTSDYIILDTERYVYKIMVSDSENPTINNPNNENITITGPSINDSDIEDTILNSSNSKDYEDNVESVTSFINSISGTLNYVKSVLELGFKNMPSAVQGFSIFIFNILCIFMILRMGGYLG